MIRILFCGPSVPNCLRGRAPILTRIAAARRRTRPHVHADTRRQGSGHGRPPHLDAAGVLHAGQRYRGSRTPWWRPAARSPFLVEPKLEVAPGVYPIRIETTKGISNVLLFSCWNFS